MNIKSRALAVFVAAIACVFTHAKAQIIVPGQGITVQGFATNLGPIWEYRYVITETAGNAVPLVRFAISEAAFHQGLHHEGAPVGPLVYDQAAAVAFGLNAHNYFWNNLALPANGVVILGFDDVHGPTFENWGIQARGLFVAAAPGDLLPVPLPGDLVAVPEANSSMLAGGLLVLLAARAWQIRRRKVGDNRGI